MSPVCQGEVYHVIYDIIVRFWHLLFALQGRPSGIPSLCTRHRVRCSVVLVPLHLAVDKEGCFFYLELCEGVCSSFGGVFTVSGVCLSELITLLAPKFARMGMCAIKGPRVLHDEPEDGELSPRSTTSTSSSGYGSASSQELDVVEASDHFYPDSALWQRTIPKGRRCKPLSFSGMILYDENGKQVELTFEPEEEEDADEEYFSPQRNLAEREKEFMSPSTVE